MNGKRSHSLRIFIYLLSFFTLIAVTALLVVARIVPSISALLKNVAQYTAFIFLALASLWYVMNKRSLVLKIVWVVCVVGSVVVLIV